MVIFISITDTQKEISICQSLVVLSARCQILIFFCTDFYSYNITNVS